MQKFRSQLQFVMRKRGWFLLAFLLISAVAAWYSKILSFNSNWQDWDKFFTLATLGVAVSIFWFEMRQEWEEQLPKRLTAFFFCESKPRMVCYEAHLAHESDVRNWAQQIGRQMAGGGDLKFSPVFDHRALGIESDQSQPFKHYQIIMYLKELPNQVGARFQQQPSLTVPCLVWRIGQNMQEDERIEEATLHRPR